MCMSMYECRPRLALSPKYATKGIRCGAGGAGWWWVQGGNREYGAWGRGAQAAKTGGSPSIKIRAAERRRGDACP